MAEISHTQYTHTHSHTYIHIHLHTHTPHKHTYMHTHAHTHLIHTHTYTHLYIHTSHSYTKSWEEEEKCMGQRYLFKPGNWKFTRSILEDQACTGLEQGEGLAILQKQGGSWVTENDVEGDD